MKILLVNKYFYLKGGSERAFFNQAGLLRQKNHQVLFFSMRDKENLPCSQSGYFVAPIDYQNPSSPMIQIMTSVKLLYSFEAKKKIDSLLRAEKPVLAHLHNIHHQLSPSIIDALSRREIPIVMSLHDYKMVCPAYTMLRDGRICELCRGGRYRFCLSHSCTKGSRLKSLLNTIEMYLHHHILKIYDKVDIFISPSRFLISKVREMGFIGHIEHLPYLIYTTDYYPSFKPSAREFCYFGRLSREKGLYTLLKAMKRVDASLKIIGTGPLADELVDRVKREGLSRVRFVGYLTGRELLDEVRNSLGVIVPSEWYENYPYSVIESFALGKAVIGANIGGIPEMVRDGETGLTFASGDVDELVAGMNYFLQNRSRVEEMGKKARHFVETELNPEKHYQRLMEIYAKAREKRKWKRL